MALDLDECRARLDWASQHLRKLKEAVVGYERSKPYTVRREFSPKEYMASLYLTAKPLPGLVSHYGILSLSH